uniref:Uncharacterized protein n=1 Tax=Anguilla anguilla TaxID=7936 RepID=A0A0E9VV42_ANGAN
MRFASRWTHVGAVQCRPTFHGESSQCTHYFSSNNNNAL